MSPIIKAPFNFVPLSEKVVYPEWANQISHDIPFSDGESGEITLKLVAKTPVFVRNGHAKEDKEASKEFNHLIDEDGHIQYFIPGTSIKGMIRNVTEIMTFGKMNLDKNMRFATRDWDNQFIYDLKKITEQQNVHCGYLFRQGDKYFIEDHGIPYRINHRRIDELIGNGKNIFRNHFSKTHGVDLNRSENGIDRKTAAYKYFLIRELPLKSIQNQRFTIDNEYSSEHQKRRVKSDLNGDIEGTIILTGQPDRWSSDNQEEREKAKGKGKFYEFVFGSEIHGSNKEVSKDDFEQFKFFHKDSEDWQRLWKNKFNKIGGKVPVFFRLQGNSIKDFGLAFLYKTPFKYSVKEIGNNHQKNFDNDKPDFAECLFGFTNKKETTSNSTKSAKGRIQFGNALAEGKPTRMDIVKTTLGSPKASYYPIYVAQNNGQNGVVSQIQDGNKQYKNYKTYHDLDNPLAGWKRYPIKSDATPRPTDNPALDTEFYPLAVDTVFIQKIRYHNLKPVELGALLSALTFHNNNDKLFHSLGMGKPLGYGKMEVSIISPNLAKDINKYLAIFEDYMSEALSKKWHQSEQIKELFSMSYDIIAQVDNLIYMTMSNEPEENEFLKAKKIGEYLRSYSELTNETFSFESVAVKIHKEETESINSNFNQQINTLKHKLDENLIDEASEIFDTIVSLTSGKEDSIIDYQSFKDIKAIFDQKVLLLSLESEVNGLVNLGKWKEARIILNDKIIPLIVDENVKSVILQRINELKVKESNELSFENSINISESIERNKGKINGYLQKKGKLKHLPESDIESFYNALIEWRKLDPKKNERKWCDMNGRNSIWQELVKLWLPEDMMVRLFERLKND